MTIQHTLKTLFQTTFKILIRSCFTGTLLVFLLSPPVLLARDVTFDPEEIVFEHIRTPGPGYSLMEDRNGFLWLGGELGLWRYDGYEFKDYRHVVPERIDAQMYQDRDGLIWIGTQSGLIAFDPVTETRVTYRHDPADPHSLSDHVFQFKKQALCEDARGRLWIATDNGLNRFDKTTGTFAVYTSEQGGLADNVITAILPSFDGLLWVATLRGLHTFDPEAGEVVRHYPGAPVNMYSLAEDAAGDLWIGAYQDGLYRFDPAAGTFTTFRHDPSDPASLSSNLIMSLLIPPNAPQGVWITTDGAGVNLLEMDTGTITRFLDDPERPERKRIQGNVFSQIIQDRMGALFVLGEEGVLNRIDPGCRQFTTLTHQAGDPGSLPKAPLYSVWTDAGGSAWVYAHARAMSRYEPATGAFHHISALPADLREGLAVDCDGTVWLAGDDYLARFDLAQEQLLDMIPVDGLIGNGLCDRTNPDLLWFGSINAGLIKVYKPVRTVSYFRPDERVASSIGAYQTLILAQDDAGMLWLSAFGVGLQRFDPQSETVLGTYVPTEFRAGNPTGFFQDSQGRYWIAYQNTGPARFDPNTGTFESFDAVTGHRWPAHGSTGILEDTRGTFWVSGNGSGELVRFSPETGEVRLYTEADGVAPGTSHSYSRRPVMAADGAFWFHGWGGVTRFFPDRITDNPYRPPVYLTALTQNGIPIKTGRTIEMTEEIRLSADHNFFEFQAAALNYRQPQRNRYQYRLRGRDDEWFNAGTRREGHYSGLDEGMYILEIKGANNDGIWNETPARLNIYVEPHIPDDVQVFPLEITRQGTPVALKPDQNNLVFETAPLDFSILAKRHYQYQLKDYDADWTHVSSSRYRIYRNVPSGRYTFMVKNTETHAQYALPITIHPPFYRSWWFLSIIGLSLIGMVGAFYTQRITHLKREHAESLRHQREEYQLEQEKLAAVEEKLAAVLAREHAVEALKESEKRHRDLLATMNEGFVIVDATDTLTYVNDRFCEMLGYDRDDMLGRPLSCFVDPANQQILTVQTAERRKGTMTPYELQWIRQDGQPVITLVSPKPIIDAAGTLRECFAVITDITDLKHTEAMLRAREQELIVEKSNLEEMNIALKVLLQKREEAIEEVEQRVLLNLKKLVSPYLEKMKHSGLNEQHLSYLNVIQSNLEEITSAFSRNLESAYADLTYTEIQIANLIRDGKLTKEIAEMLNISERTVDFHRGNIRKKLGLTGKKTDLRAFLLQFGS